jgi:hypothetical protein
MIAPGYNAAGNLCESTKFLHTKLRFVADSRRLLPFSGARDARKRPTLSIFAMYAGAGRKPWVG